jgi:hypothetical protein
MMDEQAQVYINEIRDALIPLTGRITQLTHDIAFHRNLYLAGCSYHPEIRWDGKEREECPLCELERCKKAEQDARERASKMGAARRKLTKRCDAITGLDAENRDEYGVEGALAYVERYVKHLENVRTLTENFMKLRARRNVYDKESEGAFGDALVDLVYALEEPR